MAFILFRHLEGTIIIDHTVGKYKDMLHEIYTPSEVLSYLEADGHFHLVN